MYARTQSTGDFLTLSDRRTLDELQSKRVDSARSQVDSTLSHHDRFKSAMLAGEAGRAWGIYMGFLRGEYSCLQSAIDDLCEGFDVSRSIEFLKERSSLFVTISTPQIVEEEHEFF